ncbi:polar amino acid transport system substrate-binding protein [Chitinivorax tropicus]|uniref:Polar amino acid transport system substrate-binding protein n=1 Tax=Chitinivorax tropicus TaxID=714531 RepID=A0A840MI25_9PROT|nr:transporter substrate-binding domain-containing protein [Chitinivorax tropicus]MBB5017175.1 polar amino acid transport system substrate-binding protein [Chitinivorax tropicus]
MVNSVFSRLTGFVQPFVVLVGLMAAIPRHVHATDFVVGLPEKDIPPFSFSQGGQLAGIYRDLFDRLNALTGDTYRYVHIPAMRLMRAFEQGQIDIEPGVNPSWRDGQHVESIYSVHFARTTDVLLIRNGVLKPTSLSQLSGATIGTVRGFVYPGLEASFNNRHFNRDESSDEFQLLLKLAANRYDYAVVNRSIADYWLHNRPAAAPWRVGLVVGEADVMLRMQPKHKAALGRINAALTKLRQSGEIEAIYQKYQ